MLYGYTQKVPRSGQPKEAVYGQGDRQLDLSAKTYRGHPAFPETPWPKGNFGKMVLGTDFWKAPYLRRKEAHRSTLANLLRFVCGKAVRAASTIVISAYFAEDLVRGSDTPGTHRNGANGCGVTTGRF